jgi:hypothetical protein
MKIGDLVRTPDGYYGIVVDERDVTRPCGKLDVNG